MKAYPFLFTKNKFLENGPVVLPDILNDNEAANFIARVNAGQSHTSPGHAYYLASNHPRLGSLHVVFRSRPVTTADLDQGGAEVLLDNAGRRITATEGFVVCGTESGFAYSQKHLEEVHEAVVPTFKEFWPCKRWGRKSISNTTLTFESASADNALTLIPQDEFSAQALRRTAIEPNVHSGPPHQHSPREFGIGGKGPAFGSISRVRRYLPRRQIIIFGAGVVLVLVSLLTACEWLIQRARALTHPHSTTQKAPFQSRRIGGGS